MGSLSALFDLSRSALAGDQAALNATANNVANQNTVGYTRELVSFTAGDSVSLSAGQVAGSGPTATTASQRDRVLEHRLQQQTQVQAGTSAQADVLAQIQNVFSVSGSSSGSTQLGTDLNAFFNTFSALEANPADTATRQAVLNAASTLTGDFHSASAQLTQVQSGIDSAIVSSIGLVNGLTATIAGLNRQIGSLSPGADAGTLEDQRQQAIAQLSQYVGLHQIATEGNGITLTTDGGAVLVAGLQSHELSTTTTGGTTQILDSTGHDVSATISGGSIGGRLAGQNADLPAVTAALDALAYRAGIAVNTQNSAGVDATGVPGGAIFAGPGSSPGAAAQIYVVASNPSAVAAAAAGEGSSGNGNATALAALASATDSSGQTISQQLAGLLAGIGTQASTLNEQSAAQQASLTQLTTQRDSLSGVSLDTEAANLTQYQKSYEAAAKVLTVLDSLMATAINMGTQVAVT